ncbi:transposase [Streptomyces sp. 1222.5]|uniref:transposase n=1 Tax=Streptomyces sp. 1222.5 TaxID=1881026 RepID=UPI003EBF3253
MPRRWVVERSFAWFLRSRRLVRDYERRTDTSEAVIRWSMIALMTAVWPHDLIGLPPWRQGESSGLRLHQPAPFHQPLQPCSRTLDPRGGGAVPAQHHRRPPGTQPVGPGLRRCSHHRLVVHRQILEPGRVLPMRHHTWRPDRLPLRRTDGDLGLVLLGQSLQILLEADRPASQDFFGVSQVRPHPLEFGFELLHPHHRGLPPRFQNCPHRRHPPPPTATRSATNRDSRSCCNPTSDRWNPHTRFGKRTASKRRRFTW